MNDIDLSKVPEGAQYYSASDDGFYTFYREIKESTYEIFYCGGTRWVLRVGTPEEHCPIRTPEQIAADEREAAIKAIVGLIESADSRGMTIAEAIYDAGYRKPC